MTINNNAVYFIRHGETDHNQAGLLTGTTDVALNSSGIRQAQKAAEEIVSLSLDEIWSSPLKRAKQTAEIISNIANIPVHILSELSERHYGKWEGLSKVSLNRNTPPDGGETDEAFFSRAQFIITQINSTSRNILIVSHSGIFRQISKNFRNVKTKEINNGQIVRII